MRDPYFSRTESQAYFWLICIFGSLFVSSEHQALPHQLPDHSTIVLFIKRLIIGINLCYININNSCIKLKIVNFQSSEEFHKNKNGLEFCRKTNGKVVLTLHQSKETHDILNCWSICIGFLSLNTQLSLNTWPSYEQAYFTVKFFFTQIFAFYIENNYFFLKGRLQKTTTYIWAFGPNSSVPPPLILGSLNR